MEAVFSTIQGFFKGLTGLVLTVLGLGVAVELTFGPESIMGISVMSNVMAVINGLSAAGFMGLVGILIFWTALASNVKK